MADLVEQYDNLPLGGSDASVVALAERLGVTTVMTHYRHFSAQADGLPSTAAALESSTPPHTTSSCAALCPFERVKLREQT